MKFTLMMGVVERHERKKFDLLVVMQRAVIQRYVSVACRKCGIRPQNVEQDNVHVFVVGSNLGYVVSCEA